MIWVWIVVGVVVITTLIAAFGTPTLPSLPAGAGTSVKTWFGNNWKFLVIVGILVWGFKGCYDNSKKVSHTSASRPSEVRPKREISLTAYPGEVTRLVDLQIELAPGARYEVIRSGTVIAYPEGNTNKPVLLTPDSHVDCGAKWSVSFKAPGRESVALFIREL
ncbi:MAG: hypothetical protein RLZZ347_60 [Candidatus Parcubacteria bacterium]|jgi:hypothetical protein